MALTDVAINPPDVIDSQRGQIEAMGASGACMYKIDQLKACADRWMSPCIA